MSIEDHGTFQTNTEYWDCMCSQNYIHEKVNGTFCPTCKMYEVECPDSRVDEIKGLYRIENDEELEKL